MPVCGLVITFVEDEERAAGAMRHLQDDPAFALGEQQGRRLAVALDSPDNRTHDEQHRRLLADPGILHVDTTFIELDPTPGAAPVQPETNYAQAPTPPHRGAASYE